MTGRIFTVCLALLIAVALTVGVCAAFERTQSYGGQFADVSPDAWYAASVADAYEIGFMRGTADNAFSPDGSVTVQIPPEDCSVVA